MFRLIPALLLAQTSAAFFFGGGGGGGCGCQPQPACAPPPVQAPCSGGSVVSGYAAPPQQGYAAFPQQGFPQGGYAAPQQQAPQLFQGPSYPQPGGYQRSPVGGYQPQQQPQQYQQQSAQGGSYAEQAPQQQQQQQQPEQPAQQVEHVQETQQTPHSENYRSEQQVAVSTLAREEPNYQATNDAPNIVEAAQAAAEYSHQAASAAAAAKVAEVIEEDEPRAPVQILKKDEGKTLLTKKKTPKPTVRTTTSSTTKVETTTIAASTQFPVGEEVIPETNEKEIDISELHLIDDPLCNSDELRKVVIDNIDDQLNSSKRMIQLAAEAQFGGRFDVICANGDFSYVTNTELYCQETKNDISCYTYRQL